MIAIPLGMRVYQDQNRLPVDATIGLGAEPIHRQSPTCTHRGGAASMHCAISPASQACSGRRLRRYRQLTKPERDGGPLVLANCWGHFRRQFYDIAKGGNAPIATEALQRIAALYSIEDEIRGQGADQRRVVRQERARSLVDRLECWLEQQLAIISKGSPLADAIRYGLNHWQVSAASSAIVASR